MEPTTPEALRARIQRLRTFVLLTLLAIVLIWAFAWGIWGPGAAICMGAGLILGLYARPIVDRLSFWKHGDHR